MTFTIQVLGNNRKSRDGVLVLVSGAYEYGKGTTGDDGRITFTTSPSLAKPGTRGVIYVNGVKLEEVKLEDDEIYTVHYHGK